MDGVAVTLEPVGEDKVPEGLQLYVEAPPAVSVVLEPLHIVMLALAVTVGPGILFTVALAVAVQLVASVTVTV